MKRWALNLLTAFTAALALVTTVLWLESDRSHPVVRWNLSPHGREAADWTSYALRLSDGRVVVSRLTYNFDAQAAEDLFLILKQAEESNVTRRLTRRGLSITFGVPPEEYPESRQRHTRVSSLAGFSLERTNAAANSYQPSVRVFSAPAWLLSLLLMVLPLSRIISYCNRVVRRRIRVRSRLCPQCRYDLRATPGRCPECGYHTLGLAGHGSGTQ